MTDRLTRLLGLGLRAGRVVVGVSGVRAGLQRESVHCVVLAADASLNRYPDPGAAALKAVLRKAMSGILPDVVRDRRLTHRPEVRGGVLAEESSAMLKAFFKARRG